MNKLCFMSRNCQSLPFLLPMLISVFFTSNGVGRGIQLTEAAEISKIQNHYKHKQKEQQQQQEQQQRQLQEDFRIPFFLTWSIDIGNGATDREPTGAEYETVVEATINWLTENTESIFNGETLQLENIQCGLQPNGQSWDSTGTTQYPHIIQLACEVLWNEESSNTDAIPSQVQYLQTLNRNTEVTDFILNYLYPSADSTLFGYSQAVSYFASTIANATPPSSTTGGPQQPSLAPISRPPTPSFSNAYILPARLTFDLSIQTSETDREPTQEEYIGFQTSVNEWLYNSLQNAYRNETNNFYVSDVTSDIESTRYDPTIFSGLTHQIVLNTYVMYHANTIQDVPHVTHFFVTLQSNDVSFNIFVSDYIPIMVPSTSIFRSTETIQYASSSNGSVYSADDNDRPTTTTTTTPASSPPPQQPTANPPTTMTPPATPTPPISPISLDSTGVERNDFENTISVSVSFLHHYKLFPNAQVGGEPSKAEWDGLGESTRNFWSDTLQYYYQNNVPNIDFVYVDGKWVIDSMEYDPNKEFPYSGRYITDILFKEGSTNIPTNNDMKQMMSTMLTGSNYITTYIRAALPEDSLFHSTFEIQWDF